MENIKTEKGITLIALIITIVVLLILAVVAIGQAQETNIVGYAQNAAGKFEEAKSNEVDDLTKYEKEIEKYINGNNIKSGCYVHAIDDENETKLVWYVEVKEKNTIDIRYCMIQNNSIIREINLENIKVIEEKVNNMNLTNYIDGSPIIVEPNYFVIVGGNAYIKDDKFFAADTPEDENTPHIIAILDENFVLPE